VVRDLAVVFELETLARDQPPSFVLNSMSLLAGIPRKQTVTAAEQQNAAATLEADDNSVVTLFVNKLRSDQAQFKLYLEKLSDSETVHHRLVNQHKLMQRRASDAATKAVMDQYIYQAVIGKSDLVGFCAELCGFQKHVLASRPTTPDNLVTIGILDLAVTDGSLDESLTRMASLLRNNPDRGVAAILLPWDVSRNISESIQSLGNIASGFAVCSMVCDLICTLFYLHSYFLGVACQFVGW
jgi:hypothetical protein